MAFFHNLGGRFSRWILELGMVAVVLVIYETRSLDPSRLAPTYSVRWVLFGTLLGLGVVGWVRFAVRASARLRWWLSRLRDDRRRRAA